MTATLNPPRPSVRSEPQAATTRPMYRTIWRWHFFAGMIVAPILLVMATTGAVLVFADDLRPRVHPERYIVQAVPSGARATLDAQVAAARKADEGSSVT